MAKKKWKIKSPFVLQCLRLLTHTFNSEYNQVVSSISDCKVRSGTLAETPPTPSDPRKKFSFYF